MKVKQSTIKDKKRHLQIDVQLESNDRYVTSYSFRSNVAIRERISQKPSDRNEERSRKSSQYAKTESDIDLNSKSKLNQSHHTKNSPSLFEFIARVKNNSVQTVPADAQSLDNATNHGDGGRKTESDISAKSQDERLISRYTPKERTEKIKAPLTGTKKTGSALKNASLPLKVQTPPNNISSVLFDPKQTSFKRQTMTVNFLKEKLGDEFETLKAIYIKSDGNPAEMEKRLGKDKASLVKLFPIAFGFATPTTQGSVNFSAKE